MDFQKEYIKLQDYHVTAKNLARDSENKIHDDEVARNYGFKGGLVPGVSIYSYMTYPIVTFWGRDWLKKGRAHIFLHKPVFDGDRLTIRAIPYQSEKSNSLEIFAINHEGIKCATCNATLPEHPEPLFKISEFKVGHPLEERIPISWDAIEIGKPLSILLVDTSIPGAISYAKDHNDNLDLYNAEEKVIHPGFLLQQANRVFSSHFILGPWLHVESVVQNFEIVHIGDPLKVMALPSEKFEKKGHEFIKLEVNVFSRNGKIIQQILHTAIFRIKPLRP